MITIIAITFWSIIQKKEPMGKIQMKYEEYEATKKVLPPKRAGEPVSSIFNYKEYIGFLVYSYLFRCQFDFLKFLILVLFSIIKNKLDYFFIFTCSIWFPYITRFQYIFVNELTIPFFYSYLLRNYL